MSVDLEHLRSWIGRTESLHDTATLARRMLGGLPPHRALLDHIVQHGLPPI